MRYNCKCEGNKTRRVFVISSNKYHKQQNERKQTIELEKKNNTRDNCVTELLNTRGKKMFRTIVERVQTTSNRVCFWFSSKTRMKVARVLCGPWVCVCVCVTQKRNILLPSKWIKNKNCSYTHEYRWIYGVLLYTHANPWNIVDTGMWLYALQANELNYFRMCINTAL